jgi:hypothetical protein
MKGLGCIDGALPTPCPVRIFALLTQMHDAELADQPSRNGHCHFRKSETQYGKRQSKTVLPLQPIRHPNLRRAARLKVAGIARDQYQFVVLGDGGL